jgi:5-methyltetrahydrofolate--homocysteine methyltransferase
MIQIVKGIRALHPDVPILVHANAGLPQYTNGETIFPESPLDMASRVKELIECGANIVGGCCGTTPEHIQEIKKEVQN